MDNSTYILLEKFLFLCSVIVDVRSEVEDLSSRLGSDVPQDIQRKIYSLELSVDRYLRTRV